MYISACRYILIKITGVSFVDDTGLGITLTYNWNDNLTEAENKREDLLHTLNSLQTLAQHWERLSIHWIWKNGKAQLATSSQAPGTIKLTSGDNQLQPNVRQFKRQP